MAQLEGVGHEKRSGRARVRIDAPTGPTKHSRLVANAVPEVAPNAGDAAVLAAGLSSFFGLVGNTLDKAADAQHKMNMLDIREENRQAVQEGRKTALLGKAFPEDKKTDKAFTEGYEAIKAAEAGSKRRREETRAEHLKRKDAALAGAAQASRGQPMDEARAAADRDYRDGFVKRTAIGLAYEAKQEWETIRASLKPGEDVEKRFEAFLEEKMKAGQKFGTGVDLFDTTFVGTLEAATREGRVSSRILAQKRQMLQQQGLSASNLVNRLEAGQVTNGSAAVKEMMLANPSLTRGEAASKVADSLFAYVAATGGYKRATQAIRLLRESGYAKQFPVKFEKRRQAMLQAAQTIRTQEGQMAFANINQGLFKLKQADQNDSANIIAAASKLLIANEQARQQHGGQSGAYKANLSAIRSYIAPLLARNRDLNLINETRARGGVATKLINKHYAHLYARLGGPKTLWENPLAVADFAHKHGIAGGTIGPGLKSQVTEGLLKGDPEKFGAAMTAIKSVIDLNDGNVGVGLNMAGTDAHTIIQYALTRRGTTGQSWDTIRQEFLTGAERIASLKTKGALNFKSMIGTDSGSVASAREKVEAHIAQKTAEAFGISKSEIPPTLLRKLSGLALEDWAATGGQSWTDVTNALVKSAFAGGRFHLVPSTDDDVRLEQLDVPRPGTIIEPGYDPTVGGIGGDLATARVAVAFNEKVVNPHGVTENTIETWQKDKSTLADVIYGGKAGSASDMSLNGKRPSFARRGIYMVMTGGRETVFNAGDIIVVNGEKVVLAANIDERKAQLWAAGLFNPAQSSEAKRRRAERAADVDLALKMGVGVPRVKNVLDQRERTLYDRFTLVEENGVLFLGYRPGFVAAAPPPKPDINAILRKKAEDPGGRAARARRQLGRDPE